MERDEQLLIRDVLAGRRESFRGLVERYQGPVFRLVRNLVADEHEREDLAQEVFLAALAGLASYDPSRARFSTWLLTIARNKCLNYLRRKRPATLDGPLERLEAQTPFDPAQADELRSRLDTALAQLPLEQRTAFVLAEIEGLPYGEIAKIEQTRLGTVKSRIARAKQHLRSALRQELEQQ